MRISSIRGQNFMAYGEFSLDLPDKGIVLISGKNGEGKSGLVEAVAVALWGDGLRERWSPWRTGEAGWVEARTLTLHARRSVTKSGAKSLTSTASEGAATMSKAQEMLDAVIPPFEVWKKCCVFGSDAALFTGATDGDRKRLLESIMGIARFDSAQASCGRDLRAKEVLNDQISSRIVRAEGLLARESQALKEAADAMMDMAGIVDPEYTSDDVRKLEKKHADLLASQQSETSSQRSILREAADASAQRKIAEQNLERFKSGACPTCERPVDKDFLAAKRYAFESADLIAQEADERARERERQATEKIEALRKEANDLRTRVSRMSAVVAQAKQAGQVRAKIEQTLNTSTITIKRIEAELDAARSEQGTARREASELKAVESVLGLRGVRARILSRSLDGLEAMANGYLRELSSDIQIALKPYTQRKSGSTAEAISIDIQGAGGGQGYPGASTGQRRRVDIALLLALAEMSEAALRHGPSTLFFDEVFDGLDAEGVYALGEVLQEMASQRAVVVISHHPSLIEHLNSVAALRVHVEGHKVIAQSA